MEKISVVEVSIASRILSIPTVFLLSAHAWLALYTSNTGQIQHAIWSVFAGAVLAVIIFARAKTVNYATSPGNRQNVEQIKSAISVMSAFALFSLFDLLVVRVPRENIQLAKVLFVVSSIYSCSFMIFVYIANMRIAFILGGSAKI